MSSTGVAATATQRLQLGETVMEFFHRYRQTLQAATAAAGLTVQQAMLIDGLPAHDPQPMTAIANMLGCDTSNATGLVDRLERHKLVRRQASSADRRVRTVVLTAAGRQAKEELLRLTRTDNPLFVGLDEQTCRDLTALLRHVAMRPADDAAAGQPSSHSSSSPQNGT